MTPPDSRDADYGARMKSKAGLERLTRALGYTWDGLRAAYRHEHAFRQELWAVAPFALAAWALPGLAAWVRALLFGSLILVLIVALLTSSIDATTAPISLERHPLAKRAKDMGSAAVFLAIVNAVLIWACCLWSAYGTRLFAWLG